MIGVYSICHGDGDMLAFNIGRMYEWADRFSVAVGPVHPLLDGPPDPADLEALAELHDPAKKVRVVSGVWESKNVEADAALAALRDCEIIFQVDADEFWPEEAWNAAVNCLTGGWRKVAVHMWTFWKDLDHVLTTWRLPGIEDFDPANGRRFAVPSVQEFQAVLHFWRNEPEKFRAICEAVAVREGEATPWLLDMPRAFRPEPWMKIVHVPPDLAFENGQSAAPGVTIKTPIWHLSYIGADKVARKFDYFNAQAKGTVMPPMDYFHRWRPEPNLTDNVRMTGQRRGFAKYGGEPIPEDIRRYAEAMIARATAPEGVT